MADISRAIVDLRPEVAILQQEEICHSLKAHSARIRGPGGPEGRRAPFRVDPAHAACTAASAPVASRADTTPLATPRPDERRRRHCDGGSPRLGAVAVAREEA